MHWLWIHYRGYAYGGKAEDANGGLTRGGGLWELDTTVQEETYDPEEMILAWELEAGETRCLPQGQYFDTVVAVLVIAK
jgi:hypothetical protein